MPAMTSPLMALRFSGRLMVIQSACPRFWSRMELVLLSVMAVLARLVGRTIEHERRTWEQPPARPPATRRGRWGKAAVLLTGLRYRNGGGRSLLHPDLVVVEGRAADGCDGLSAGEHVDAAAADMGLVRMHRLRDQYAAPHAVEQFCRQRGLAAHVAERDRVAVGDAKRSGIVGMNHHAGRAFARLRRRRLVEAG